jgi:outer membrane receptor protein involved in Fe transport
LKRFDVKAAWRILDVKTDHHIGLLQKALTPRHRGFLNLAYTTARRSSGHWTFDVTVQHIGGQRLPNTSTYPEGLRLDEYAPDYRIVHGQVTRRFANNLDIYLGAENLLDFKQEDPILSADDPFGPYFDSGLAWGPIVGRTVYLGVRFLMNRVENE